jgi:uncharacterized spore protein YtfJ
MTRMNGLDVDRLVDSARDTLTVQRVFGDPIDHNGVEVIPAARLRGGAGGGGGSETAEEGSTGGSGGGFGLVAAPAGAFVVNGDDVRWVAAVNRERIAMAALGLAACALLVIRSIMRTTTRCT